MRHRVVQTVEALVQPVVTEVVLEMSDLDVPPKCPGLDSMAQRIEQPVLATGLITNFVPERRAESVTDLLIAQRRIVSGLTSGAIK